MRPTLQISQYVSVNINLLEKFGCLEPYGLSKKQRIFYQIYSFVLIGIFCNLKLISEFAEMCVQTDIPEITRILYMFISEVLVLIKLYPIIRNMKKTLEMFHMNRPEFLPRSKIQWKIFNNDVTFQRKLSITFFVMGICASLSKSFFPIIDSGRGGQLPFAGLYPFPVDHAPVYQIIYLHQVTCILFLALSDIAYDTLISGSLMAAANQLKMVKDDIINMRAFSEAKVRRKHYSNEEYSAELHKEMKIHLIKCVHRHQQALEFAEEVVEIFTIPLLFQFVAGIIIIGLTLFQYLLTPVFTLEFYSIASYQLCILLEIFLYCYYGNEVMLQSDSLTNALYHCGWEETSVEFQKMIVFFMTRTQKRTTLFAGNLITMSLPTFLMILRSSWSYFAVMNRVYRK